MIPVKPYLLRALYEWILDNSHTPYIVADAMYPNVSVPERHIKNGEITLDISPDAVNKLVIDNKTVTFKARFGGIAHDIYMPIPSIIAIYPAETGQGMTFPQEEPEQELDNDELAHSQREETRFEVVSGGKEQ